MNMILIVNNGISESNINPAYGSFLEHTQMYRKVARLCSIYRYTQTRTVMLKDKHIDTLMVPQYSLFITHVLHYSPFTPL